MVRGVNNLNAPRQRRSNLIDNGFGGCNRLDNVRFTALRDVNGDRCLAVNPNKAPTIFKTTPHGRHIAERDHGVRRGFDRQIEQIAGILYDTRHLQGKAALAVVQAARRNQPVITGQHPNQLFP